MKKYAKVDDFYIYICKCVRIISVKKTVNYKFFFEIRTYYCGYEKWKEDQ